MCGRYWVETDGSDEIAAIIEEVNRRGESVKTGEIYPCDRAAVIERDGARAMRWGFSGGGGPIINARCETRAQKGLFKDCERVLVPASGYFEWAARGREKIRYRLWRADGPLYLAGLKRREAEEDRFVIVTRAPFESIAFVHDRMPLFFSRAAARTWLLGGAEDAPDRTDVLFERADRQISFFEEARS